MLTDTKIKTASAQPKTYKLYDTGGLFLEITPNGSKLWRFKFRFNAKEKLLALGKYPSVSLKQARKARDNAKETLSQGTDPSQHKKLVKLQQQVLEQSSFEILSREWFKSHLSTKAKGHRDKVIQRLERDVFPYVGTTPITSLGAPEILALAKRVQARGSLETAHRVIQNVGQVIRFAIATGRASLDPTPSLRGALPSVIGGHMAAVTTPEALGEILRAMDAFKGGPIVGVAMRLLPYLFCRPGELRTMRWDQLNFDTNEWRYRVSKTGQDHVVPLSRQAVNLIRNVYPLTGNLPGGWVFTGGRVTSRPMSDAAIVAALRRLGIDTQKEQSAHGFRATARTLLHEQLAFRPEIIEHQLAHSVPDALGTAYNRTKFLQERKIMMQTWADFIDNTKDGNC